MKKNIITIIIIIIIFLGCDMNVPDNLYELISVDHVTQTVLIVNVKTGTINGIDNIYLYLFLKDRDPGFSFELVNELLKK